MKYRYIIGFLLLAVIPSLAGMKLHRFDPGMAVNPGFLPPVANGSQINMPYVFHTSKPGWMWDIQHDGSIGDGGNDLYDGGGQLHINGQNFYNHTGVATFDPKNNEITLGPTRIGQFTIARKISVDPDRHFCRTIDIIENSTAQTLRTTATLYYNMGGAAMFRSEFNDPKKRGNVIGMAIGDQRNYVAMIGAGRGSNVVPSFVLPHPQSDDVRINYDLELQPNQKIALLHVQARAESMEQAMAQMQETRDREYLKNIPKDLQKLIINFKSGGMTIDDLDVLRGDQIDVVELKSAADRHAEQHRGVLRDNALRILTTQGLVEVPIGRVAGMINLNGPLPRQAVVTLDGEVFYGRLQEQYITLERSNRQLTRFPLSSIARVGTRQSEDEPEELDYNRPMAFLAGGDRILLSMPTEPIAISTRFGPLSVKPEQIARIDFRSTEQAAHEITLKDGSRFAGIIDAGTFELRPSGVLAGRSLSVLQRNLSVLQFNMPVEEVDENELPMLTTTGGDQLVATLVGTLNLQAAFDDLNLNSAEIVLLAPVAGRTLQVNAQLWDQTSVNGTLASATIPCVTRSGLRINMPVALIDHYRQPRPRPSEPVVREIHDVVKRLDDDDWRVRESAQKRLVEMGPVVISVLSEMRRSVPVEASQRIDQILADLRGIDRNSTDTAQPVDIDGDGIPDGFFEFGQPMFINPEVDW